MDVPQPVDCDVDDQLLVAGKPNPDEGSAVLQSRRRPASCDDRGFELVPSGGDVGPACLAEEVEIFGGALGEAGSEECPAAGQQKSCGGRQ